MEKLSRYLWSTLLFVYSPPTKNSAVDSLCQKAVGYRCFGLSIGDLRVWLQFWLHFQILGRIFVQFSGHSVYLSLFDFLSVLKNIKNFITIVTDLWYVSYTTWAQYYKTFYSRKL